MNCTGFDIEKRFKLIYPRNTGSRYDSYRKTENPIYGGHGGGWMAKTVTYLIY